MTEQHRGFTGSSLLLHSHQLPTRKFRTILKVMFIPCFHWHNRTAFYMHNLSSASTASLSSFSNTDDLSNESSLIPRLKEEKDKGPDFNHFWMCLMAVEFHHFHTLLTHLILRSQFIERCPGLLSNNAFDLLLVFLFLQSQS